MIERVGPIFLHHARRTASSAIFRAPPIVPGWKDGNHKGAAGKNVGMRVISGVLGVLMLLVTTISVLRTLVLPRGSSPVLIKVLWEPWRAVLHTIARFTTDYEVRDRIMAWLGPLVLISQLIDWLAGM